VRLASLVLYAVTFAGRSIITSHSSADSNLFTNGADHIGRVSARRAVKGDVVAVLGIAGGFLTPVCFRRARSAARAFRVHRVVESVLPVPANESNSL